MITVATPLTLDLAKALGLYMILAGLSGLIAPDRWRAILEGLRANAALVYVAGVAVLAIGAAIVIAHNLWTDPLSVIVTLIGWGAMVEGGLFIAWPEPILKLGASVMRPGAARPYAIVAIIAGAALLLAGFLGRAGI